MHPAGSGCLATRPPALTALGLRAPSVHIGAGAAWGGSSEHEWHGAPPSLNGKPCPWPLADQWVWAFLNLGPPGYPLPLGGRPGCRSPCGSGTSTPGASLPSHLAPGSCGSCGHRTQQGCPGRVWGRVTQQTSPCVGARNNQELVTCPRAQGHPPPAWSHACEVLASWHGWGSGQPGQRTQPPVPTSGRTVTSGRPKTQGRAHGEGSPSREQAGPAPARRVASRTVRL